MDFTINLLWVIIAAIALLGTFIASLVKSSREAERFESWLKTHEKEIIELRGENKAIRESQSIQNSTFMLEIRKVENIMGDLKMSNGIIQATLNILINNGRAKANEHHES